MLDKVSLCQQKGRHPCGIPVEVGIIVNKDLARLRDQPYLHPESATFMRVFYGGGVGISYFDILILDLGPREVLDRLALEEDLIAGLSDRAIVLRGGVEGRTHHPAICGGVAEGWRPRRRLGRTQKVRLGVPQ
jgi:hypothetical protein